MAQQSKHCLTNGARLGLFLAAILALLITSCTTGDKTPQPTSTLTSTPLPHPTPTSPPIHTPTPHKEMTDREVLVALYHATDGPNWRDNTNWLSDKPLDEWFGVTTSSNGRVTELSFYDNNLRGTIPPELGNLSNLKWLELAHTQLTGNIPPQLSNPGEPGRLIAIS